jgi:hypothetical protein
MRTKQIPANITPHWVGYELCSMRKHKAQLQLTSNRILHLEDNTYSYVMNRLITEGTALEGSAHLRQCSFAFPAGRCGADRCVLTAVIRLCNGIAHWASLESGVSPTHRVREACHRVAPWTPPSWTFIPNKALLRGNPEGHGHGIDNCLGLPDHC